MTGNLRGGRVNLAAAPDFAIGSLQVRPPRRQVILPDGTVRDLEPLVMKVLVALAEARSEVVSRDQLIDRCWDGRIVGDDALNRCIVALRTLAKAQDPPDFSIQTFPRVGYSLVELAPGEVEAAPDPAPDRRISRRNLLAGAGVAAILAAGGGIYWATRPRAAGSTNELALEWYRRGVETREQGLPELFPQVQAHFREAVAADPEFAEAWSALALAYASPVFLESGDEQAALAQRARSAAEQALRLDPDSLEAQTALAFIPSEFGRWGDSQAQLRALMAKEPESPYLRWVLLGRLTHSLTETGRCSDALELARKLIDLKPLHPNSRNFMVTTLWMTGQIEEAERESAATSARWPVHPGVFITRLAFLTFSGRAQQALDFAHGPNRPPGVTDGVLERRLAVAQALATGAASDIERAAALYREHMATYYHEMIPAARFFASVGQLDEAFEIIDGYYFNTGRYALRDRPAFSDLTRFEMTSLFWPPFAPARRDRRFDALTERIGLSRYWRDAGVQPDYKRRDVA